MYTFDSRIRYSETDENGILTIESLINYFQDCSTFQTEDDGAGLSWLTKQNLAWVLNYWQIDMFRMPQLYERVRIGTVPYALKGFLGLRNFFMDALPDKDTGADAAIGKQDAANEPARLAVANSVWSLMDMEKMMPARISKEHAARYHTDEKLPMTYLDRKIKLPEHKMAFPAEPVEVLHAHLDTNRHVNNGKYVQMALQILAQLWEEISVGFMDRKSAEQMFERSVRLRAEYKQQAHLGDVLLPVVYVYEEDGSRVLAVDLGLNGKSCCVVSFSALKDH